MVKENYIYFLTAAAAFGSFSGLFLFGTMSGFFVSLFFVLATGFFCYTAKRFRGGLWAGSRKFVIYILLLSAALSLTANKVFIVTDFLGIIILLIMLMYHQSCNDGQWGFGRWFSGIFRAFFSLLGNIYRIVADFGFYRKNKNINSIYLYIIMGILIAIPLTWVMTVILMYADELFYDIVAGAFRWLDFKISFGRILYALLAAAVSYGFFVFGYEMEEEGTLPEKRRYHPVSAIISYGVLTAMYVIFCMVQVAHLFVHEYNISYSSFAREGFFNLVFVAFVNLVLALLGNALFRKDKRLNVIMVIMSVCTYIMMISAAARIFIYVRAYGMSVLRLFAIWAVIVLAVIFAGVVKHIFDGRFRLFPYAFHVFTIMFILLSVSRPDYIVAKYNLSQEGYDDFGYIQELSLDAVPAVMASGNSGLLTAFRHRLADELDEDFAKYNFSELVAEILLGNIR